MNEAKKSSKRHNLLVNLGFNIIIPSVIMIMFDDWFGISPALALVLALLFPLGYGGLDLIKTRKWNLFSSVGFFSLFITGGIGLFQLPREWIAIKEASVPVIFFVFIVLSSFSERTFLEKLLLDEGILDADLVYARLQTAEKKAKLHKIMLHASIILALSFVLSAVLNFLLAKAVVRSESGSVEFTKELGRMVALSYPIIVFPCTAVLYWMLHYVVKKLENLTELTANELLDLR
jgi:intracellular septation protein A